jgi:glutamate N-acetyltransferase/amino-acid N-acetyltransferase
MKNSLLNIKGVSCAAINAGIKHAQNSSANSKIEDAEKLDLSISRVFYCKKILFETRPLR